MAIPPKILGGVISAHSKLYLSAPLPFVGQKRMFAKHFIEVIRQYPTGTVFVDLFGGSGLLSHITKHYHPTSRVVYNDFDNYRRRIDNIPRTNALLDRIRPISDAFPRHKPIVGDARERIFSLLEAEEKGTGYLDFITLSTSLLFSMKYKMSIEAMRGETLYNNVRKAPYAPCPDYLDGLEIVSCDYRELFEKFKDVPDVVFLVDPPYLSTDVGTYRMYWRLADYLDVLSVLPGHNFVYFTSEKSCIVELCEWMGRNPSLVADGITNVIEFLEDTGVKVIEVAESDYFEGLRGYANDNITIIVNNSACAFIEPLSMR